MKAYQILYIGTFAYGNIVNITSCDNTGPKAGVSAYTHIAGQEYAGCNKASGSILGLFPIKLRLESVYMRNLHERQKIKLIKITAKILNTE